MCYPQILKYEIKVRTGIHSPNEVEDIQNSKSYFHFQRVLCLASGSSKLFYLILMHCFGDKCY